MATRTTAAARGWAHGKQLCLSQAEALLLRLLYAQGSSPSAVLESFLLKSSPALRGVESYSKRRLWCVISDLFRMWSGALGALSKPFRKLSKVAPGPIR